MCCGHQRASYRSNRSSGRSPDPSANRRAPLRQPPPWSDRYRYVGATALSVRGPISGRLYRFESPGAVLVVDRRDARSLAGVPGLQPAGG